MASPLDRDPHSSRDPGSASDGGDNSKQPPIEYLDDERHDNSQDGAPQDGAPQDGAPQDGEPHDAQGDRSPAAPAPPPLPQSDQSISIHARSVPLPGPDPLDHLDADESTGDARDNPFPDLAPPPTDKSPAPEASGSEPEDEPAGEPAVDQADSDANDHDANDDDANDDDDGGETSSSGDRGSAPREASKPRLALRIPNGTAGKAYRADIPIQISDPPTSLIDAGLEFSGLSDLGIEYEVFEHRVVFEGTPNRDGEHSIRVRFRHPRSGSREYPLSFLVNPDPRSLWKDLEPPDDAPFPKPHLDSDRKVGDVTLIAASRRGRSHAHSGTFRDDDFSLEFVDEWSVLSVADGAGSAKFSRRGAAVACDVVIERTTKHLRGSLDGEFEELLARYAAKEGDMDEARRQIGHRLYASLGDAAMAAYRAVQQEAESVEGSQLKDFATTLLFAICRRFDFGWFVGSFAIGDGGIGVYRAEDDVVILNRPDGGDFAGQTRFLTMSDIWTSPREIANRLGFCVVEDMTALCLMTDGVSDPKFQTDNNFFDTTQWHEFWNDLGGEVGLDRDNVDADVELLEWLDFWSKGNHDDRTIAILLP